MKRLVPCLWFDRQALEAAQFYCEVFPDTEIVEKVLAPADYPAGAKGDVLLVEMSLLGQPVTLLNGGPYFTHSEAFSYQVFCDSQAETDRLWEALSAHPECEQCGWVKDKYGLSWQLIPRRFDEIMRTADPDTAERVMKAMLQMKKLDLAEIERVAAASH